ncbi:DUF4132 domain-containing protein [Streptomyces griseoviridis]
MQETEDQGYASVDAGHAPRTAVTAHAEGAPPDEDAFTLPAAWRHRLRPRWGGIASYVHHPHDAALDSWERRLATAKEKLADILAGRTTPDIDPELAAAARRFLDGTADPVGAAVLAVASDRGRLIYDEVVDAWHLRHGRVFAARATVELFAIDHEDDYDRTTRLAVLPEDGRSPRLWLRRGAADRTRALLSTAGEPQYREVVAALAAHRGDARRRIVVSYLAPDETDWVAECCADPGESGREDRVVRAMLFESLNDEKQLRSLLREGGVSAHDGSLETAATVAEGVGPAVAALIALIWRHRTPTGGASAEELASVLVELPTDEAFELLMAHADDKEARPALLEAARRYPVRAARLLAGRAAPAQGRNSFLLDQLLTAHVATHGELLEPRLDQLPPGPAARIRRLLHPTVPDAPADTLPALLVSPPWTSGRTSPEPRTVKGLVADEEIRMRWRPDEREAWAAVEEPERRARRGQQEPFPDARTVEERFGHLDNYRLAALFADGPDTYRPLLARWTPDNMWTLVDELKPVAARWEEDALPPLLHAAVQQPTAGELLLPYRQVAVARLMADWHVRLKSTRATTRAWFARHGTDAASLLVPDAAGPAGPARHNAEHALRSLAATQGKDAVLDAAAAHGPEAVDVIRDLLSADRLELALPSRIPAPAAWAAPRLLPRVLLREGTSALPDDSVRHLLTMLAISKPGAVYTGVQTVQETTDPASLASFAWALFEQWRVSGMPAKESWALHALGWLGDDDTARRLAPIVRLWPGEGLHQRAVEGLDVLAAIGSDVALTHLHGVSQRVKFKALRTRAQERIEQVAADRGLPPEELADLLVPDLGLDADCSTVVDYGPRRFTVGFDDQLRPYVLDQNGKRRKDLPKPDARDDDELASTERKRFTALKKDVRTVAADQVRRLESAMVTGRAWTTDAFRERFVSHPLLSRLTRRLVWLCVPADPAETTPHEPVATTGAGAATAMAAAADAAAVTPFRVRKDRTFTDVHDEEFTLPEDATVRLAHPLHLGEHVTDWQNLLAAGAIPQPFPQLARAVHRLTDDEAAGDRLERFENLTVPTTALLGLERRGWERDEPMFGGLQCQLSKRVAKNRWIVVSPSEGFTIGAVDVTGDQSLEYVGLSDQPSAWSPRGEPAHLTFAELDQVTASELLADLTELTATHTTREEGTN